MIIRQYPWLPEFPARIVYKWAPQSVPDDPPEEESESLERRPDPIAAMRAEAEERKRIDAMDFEELAAHVFCGDSAATFDHVKARAEFWSDTSAVRQLILEWPDRTHHLANLATAELDAPGGWADPIYGRAVRRLQALMRI